MRSFVLAFLLLPLFCSAQLATSRPPVPVVLLTDAADLRATVDQVDLLRGQGLEVAVVPGVGCYLGRAETSAIAALRLSLTRPFSSTPRHLTQISSPILTMSSVCLTRKLASSLM